MNVYITNAYVINGYIINFHMSHFIRRSPRGRSSWSGSASSLFTKAILLFSTYVSPSHIITSELLVLTSLASGLTQGLANREEIGWEKKWNFH